MRWPAASRPKSRFLKGGLAAAVVIAIAVIATVLATRPAPGSAQTPAELTLQRKQLTLVTRQLLEVKSSVEREAAASRRAWPSIARGLPAKIDPSLAAAIKRANDAAERLQMPQFLTLRHELAGPAARIAGALHEFIVLAQHGWAHIQQASRSLRDGPSSVASFERSNAGLYIDSIYDGHFAASLIGEKVRHSYERLGAGAAFGSRLTPAQVESVASAYSPAGLRMRPHFWRELLAQL